MLFSSQLGATTLTRPPVPEKRRTLDKRGIEITNLAIAPSTLKVYNSTWKKFLVWLDKPRNYVPKWTDYYNYILLISETGATENCLSRFRAASAHFAPMLGGEDPSHCNISSSSSSNSNNDINIYHISYINNNIIGNDIVTVIKLTSFSHMTKHNLLAW